MSEVIPLEVLFGNPRNAAPAISPDGRLMAYAAPLDGVLNLWVRSVGGNDCRPVTKDQGRGIRSPVWAPNGRELLYLQDQGGDENWRLYSADVESGATRDLTPFPGVQARIEKMDRKHPDQVIVGLNRENPRLHDLYRLDLRSGELEQVASNPGFIAWLIDHDLRVRGAVAPTADGGTTVVVCAGAEDAWRSLLAIPADDALFSGPLGLTGDGSGVYLRISIGANAARLVLKEIASGRERVLAEDPTYDVGGVVFHPETREAQAVAFFRERLQWEVLDPSVRDDFAAIETIQPGDFGVIDRDDADRTWLLNFTTADGPVSFYAFDRATKRSTFLFDHRPELRSYHLAAMEPFALQSRDGLPLHGYLTFPPEGGRERLPAVLCVHGGPWLRDLWGFDPLAQWFANRGYLSIQVNFRGSIGYGKTFLNAGDREWGGRMHDDLVDTVTWAVEQRLADPERVAIFGGSYGGYAALCGATFTPDLFRCAVSICGPSNLETWIETVPAYWTPMIHLLRRRVGDPATDQALLWSRSPLSRVDRIEIPILIAHGANDPRVKLAETLQVVAAMRERGIEHELMVFDDEGHGFAKPRNRLKFFAAADRFLARHLGGRAESESDADAGS